MTAIERSVAIDRIERNEMLRKHVTLKNLANQMERIGRASDHDKARVNELLMQVKTIIG